MFVVKTASPESPILFKQERVGRYKNIIIYKLRTMTNECNSNGELLPDEMRMKSWGRVLRRTNIDEIPQIWNVLKNEMSLIGPRPLLPREMIIMTEEEQEKRQSVFPGITGWEAINESKPRTRREMAEYDLYYVDNWSIIIDIKIMFSTAFIVLFNKRPEDSLRAPKIEHEV
jgi:undecaprenyl phosphate N,N'-diacetylbacillosamine 1-phosphate transferase